MPRANTEPLRRSARVTSGRCLQLQGKKFLRTLISLPGKCSFILCDGSPSLLCCVLWTKSHQAIHVVSSSSHLGPDDQSLSLFHTSRLLLCFGGVEERYCRDKDMNAGRAQVPAGVPYVQRVFEWWS